MTTLWLHVGPPKTGTSALQVFFARNAEALRRQGLLYPWGEAARDGRVSSGNARWLADWEGDYPRRLPQAKVLKRLLARGWNVLLSSEYFVTAEDRVMRALPALAGDVKVLVYVREQADTVVSGLASSMARNPDLPPIPLPDHAANFWCSLYGRTADYLDYLAELYGRKNIRVRSYKQARGRLARDAVEAMGLTPEGFDFTPLRVNETPRQKPSDPRVIAGLREVSREQNERIVREWFPGQTIEDVLDFPAL